MRSFLLPPVVVHIPEMQAVTFKTPLDWGAGEESGDKKAKLNTTKFCFLTEIQLFFLVNIPLVVATLG